MALAAPRRHTKFPEVGRTLYAAPRQAGSSEMVTSRSKSRLPFPFRCPPPPVKWVSAGNRQFRRT